MDVKNFIDLHVHIGPEVIPRKFTTAEIVKAESGKIGGLALKNHFSPTTQMIGTIEEPEDLMLIGSVTLNKSVGGLNPDVIYASARISKRPIIVWFPTISADNFLRQSKYEIPPEWVGAGFESRLSAEADAVRISNAAGELTEETTKVLRAIKKNNCILATGHVSWQDAKTLVRVALMVGIKKIIVTHPVYQLIDMPLEVQKELAQNEGVYIEQTYAMNLIDKIPISKIAEQIKTIGAANCIISSDVGQVNSPNPSEALRTFAMLLNQEGVSEKELKVMGEKNPEQILSKAI